MNRKIQRSPPSSCPYGGLVPEGTAFPPLFRTGLKSGISRPISPLALIGLVITIPMVALQHANSIVAKSITTPQTRKGGIIQHNYLIFLHGARTLWPLLRQGLAAKIQQESSARFSFLDHGFRPQDNRFVRTIAPSDRSPWGRQRLPDWRRRPSHPFLHEIVISASAPHLPYPVKQGFLAAEVSSRRLTFVLLGACFSFSGSSSASFTIDLIASMKRSISSLDSVSVGSTMIAPETTSGK